MVDCGFGLSVNVVRSAIVQRQTASKIYSKIAREFESVQKLALEEINNNFVPIILENALFIEIFD